jgi:hypothetical protein
MKEQVHAHQADCYQSGNIQPPRDLTSDETLLGSANHLIADSHDNAEVKAEPAHPKGKRNE